jgi:signal transduction histidine kinase
METSELNDVALLSEIVATQEAVSTAAFNLDAVMHEVVERSRGLTGADAAVLELVDGDEMVYRAVAGTAEAHLGLRLRVETSLSGLCARTGEIIYSEDTEFDPRVDRNATRAVGARSMLVVPLRHRAQLPYVLKVYSGRTDAFGEREEHVLRMLAASLAAAVERAELMGVLEDANDELRRLGRLKDEFLALVTHELRTPLTSIAGFVEALLSGHAGELTDQQRQFLQIVARNSDRLGGLVNDLLLAAQLEAGKVELQLEDVDLGELAEQAVRSAGPHARQAGVSLELEPAAGVRVRGDRVRLAQVLDNLVSNALKFTREGGRAEVAVSAGDETAVVTVTDDGIGIPEAEQARLFERFFRSSTATAEQIPGSGLGLSIVKTLVELHGGTIAVASTEGEGTTVRVSLPRTAD